VDEIAAASNGVKKHGGRFVAAGRGFLKKAAAAGLVRFAGWWSLFAGALALNSVCPVCGNAGCPTGIGSFGLIAAVLAFVKQYGGATVRRFFSFFTGRSTTVIPDRSQDGDHDPECCACSTDDHYVRCAHGRK
jgi:hypothetical protein